MSLWTMDLKNVAVACILGTLDLTMWLWHLLWAHWIRTCCCGDGCVGVDFEHVAVANAVGTTAFLKTI